MNKTSTAILKTGFIAGSLDVPLAFANAWFSFSVVPIHVLRFIASGLMGEKALREAPTLSRFDVFYS